MAVTSNKLERFWRKRLKAPIWCYKTPPPVRAFVGLGASSLDFKVFAWSATGDFVPMLHNVRNKVYDALNEAGIEIPFNQLVLHKAPAE